MCVARVRRLVYLKDKVSLTKVKESFKKAKVTLAEVEEPLISACEEASVSLRIKCL